MGSLQPVVAAPLGEVVTRRLSLRRLSGDDLGALAAIFADPEVWLGYGRGMTHFETEAFLSRQLKLWAECGFGGCAVRELVRPDLIGVVGLSVPTVLAELLPAVTVGWRLSLTMWGKGYATEAATAVLDQAFTTMALDRIGCVTSADNLRSIGVTERLGMRFITEASVPSDDGTRMVIVHAFQVASDEWLTIRNGEARA